MGTAGRFVVFLLGVLVLPACQPPPPPSDESYVAGLARERADRDTELNTAADSPVPPSSRSTTLPLLYFPPNPGFKVPAVLQPSQIDEVVDMPTSTGKIRAMRRVGRLGFTLTGHRLNLTAFVESGGPTKQLFVPFADETNGKESYSAGRYLDLPRTATGIYEIDFNRAYNPSCYYDPRFDCPFPPKENRLPLRVTAGERVRP